MKRLNPLNDNIFLKIMRERETKLRTVTQDDEAGRLYDIREKALHYWTSGVNHAKMEGIKEGKTVVWSLDARKMLKPDCRPATGLELYLEQVVYSARQSAMCQLYNMFSLKTIDKIKIIFTIYLNYSK
jgi:hypothetical protein